MKFERRINNLQPVISLNYPQFCAFYHGPDLMGSYRCERSNSTKKVVHKLANRPCRSSTHFLVRLYLVAILEHSKAWLAERKKIVGSDSKKLIASFLAS